MARRFEVGVMKLEKTRGKLTQKNVILYLQDISLDTRQKKLFGDNLSTLFHRMNG